MQNWLIYAGGFVLGALANIFAGLPGVACLVVGAIWAFVVTITEPQAKKGHDNGEGPRQPT